MTRDTIFTWLGGVLLPQVAELTKDILNPDLRGTARFHLMQEIRLLSNDLCLGKIPSADYCKNVIRLSLSSLNPDDLETEILNRSFVDLDVLALLRNLPDRYSLWLLIDYPSTWYKKLKEKFVAFDLFRDSRSIAIPEAGLERLIPDLFDLLIKQSGKSLEQCILIDSKSDRAVEATKRGLSGAIYVYPRHLKHEFLLRKMISTDIEVLHPSGSGRVTR